MDRNRTHRRRSGAVLGVVLGVSCALVAALPLRAQVPVPSLEFQVPPPPPVTTVTAQQTAGAAGLATYYYWVIARYPAGNAVPAGPAEVRRAGVVGGANSITVRWTVRLGATSYDVLRTVTPTLPVTGTGNMRVGLAVAAPPLVDNVAAPVAYTVSSAGQRVGAIRLDNRDFATPVITVTSPNAVTLVVRAGLTQGGADLLTIRNAAGAAQLGIDSAYGIYRSNDAGIKDIGLTRGSAGRLQINSGTAGQWGALDTGSISMRSLATPGAPVVTPTCTAACVATWSYRVCAALADATLCTAVGAQGSTAVQNATLSAVNYNTLTVGAVAGTTFYRWYRTVSGGVPATLGLIGTTTAATLVDNGLAGDGVAGPTVNNTGSLLWATDAGGSIGLYNANRPAEIYASNVIRLGASGYFGFQGRVEIGSQAAGNLQIWDWTGADFGCFQLGGVTALFPCLKRFGNALAVRQADDSVGNFAALTACAAAGEGALAVVTDSNTNVWAAVIGGGGANRVLAYCNGTNWTVAGR